MRPRTVVGRKSEADCGESDLARHVTRPNHLCWPHPTWFCSSKDSAEIFKHTIGHGSQILDGHAVQPCRGGGLFANRITSQSFSVKRDPRQPTSRQLVLGKLHDSMPALWRDVIMSFPPCTPSFKELRSKLSGWPFVIQLRNWGPLFNVINRVKPETVMIPVNISTPTAYHDWSVQIPRMQRGQNNGDRCNNWFAKQFNPLRGCHFNVLEDYIRVIGPTKSGILARAFNQVFFKATDR